MKTKHILGILIIQIITIIFHGCKKDEQTQPVETLDYKQFIDSRDGKTYQTVEIGNQLWMAENLNYNVSSGCWVYDNNSSNSEIYGHLYNWETACAVCPDGWHLPSDAEWTILTDYLGGTYVAGGKMKETGTTHWIGPNTGATNESGFLALPGGTRHVDGFSARRAAPRLFGLLRRMAVVLHIIGLWVTMLSL